MRAKVLIDNISKDESLSEWGLSIILEDESKKILLDTGKSGNYSVNAERFGINLEDVDYAVLSHAHYDHADGMDVFFEKNKKAKFFLRNSGEENCYRRIVFKNKYIGIKKGVLGTYKDRIEYVTGDFEICKNVYLIPHKTENLGKIGKKAKMYIKKGRRYIPDDFSHEQSLVIRTDKGLTILNSCSHAGVDNIINEVMNTFPGEKIYAYIGGFHLFLSSEKEVRDLAKRINETDIEKIYTGHCTGGKAFNVLKEELGERVTQLYVGLETEL